MGITFAPSYEILDISGNMKRSPKHNNFPQEVYFMFMDDNHWESWDSGMCIANCLHHIFGRGYKEGCEKSVLNAAPLNNLKEHLPKHGQWMTQAGQKYLFQKTLDFLSERGYTLKQVDIDFLEKYKMEIYKLGIRI